MRQPTKVMVNIVDLEGLKSEALERSKEKYPEAFEVMIGFAPHGFVDTPQGLYALNSEGIGPANPITAENLYWVSFYPQEKTAKGYRSPVFSSVSFGLGDTALRGLYTTMRVNLAEFIRGFGARLDRNYEAWREILELAIERRR